MSTLTALLAVTTSSSSLLAGDVMRALIDDTRPIAITAVTRCPCGRRHVTAATHARCWASMVWFGWRRHLIGDWDGTFALLVETHRPRRTVTIGLFATAADRDVAAWFAGHDTAAHLFVTTIDRPPP